RSHGIAFAADPSPQLASLPDADIPGLLEGASMLFNNTYEAALLERKTGWSAPDVLARVGVRVTTHGADVVVIEAADGERLEVAAVPAEQVVELTGVGDAFRAGFLAGRSWALPLQRC